VNTIAAHQTAQGHTAAGCRRSSCSGSGRASSDAGSADTVTLSFLHTNDLHAQLTPEIRRDSKTGGMAFLAGEVDRERARNRDNTLLLDSGDFLTGTGFSALLGVKPMAAVMDAMGYDYVALGNHDFDMGRKELKDVLEKASFQALDSNVEDDSTGGAFIADPVGNAYALRNVGGVKVGIIGLSTPDTCLTENSGNIEGLSIGDPAGQARSDIAALKKSGADMIVVLSHLGLQNDRKLADEVKGIDIILGGHSHDMTEKAVMEGSTCIVQEGCKGSHLGRVDVTFEPAVRKISNIDYRAIPVSPETCRPDSTVRELVDSYAAEVSGTVSRKLGETMTALKRSGSKDSPVGNLAADAVRSGTAAEIALLPGSLFRRDHQAGAVTMGDLLDLVPYSGHIVTMSLSGEQLIRIIGRSVEYAEPGREKSRMLQISGLTVRYDPEGKAGGRLIQVLHNGRPVSPEQQYSVATVDFLAEGGLGYRSFKNGPSLDSGSTIRDFMADYIEKHSPVCPSSTGRISAA